MKTIFAVLLILSTGLWAVAQETATNTGSNPALSGSGKKNYVPLWLNSARLASSVIFQTSGDIGIGTITPTATLDVNGAVNAATSFNLAGSPFAFGSTVGYNAFVGFAGNTTTTGFGDTAIGVTALAANTSGYFNTANGYHALNANTYGYENTASGIWALAANTTGAQNTAIGADALYNNTTGYWNTASGNWALTTNSTGYYNTATGFGALLNSNGNENTAVGLDALLDNTSGSENTAVGLDALQSNTTGNDLTCIGYDCSVASNDLTNATAIGAHAVVGQSNSLVLGGTGEHAVNVGIGTATPSNVLTIGRGLGYPVSDSWETYSSRRWKTNIHTLHGALAKVEQLRGVSYDQKDSGKHEIGVIAEEVGTVVPELVTWENKGTDAQGVDYGRLTALLIEATKEQQALINQQQEQIRAQQAQIARLTSQVSTIRASLATNSRAGSQVRIVKAQMPMVHQ